MALVKLEIDGRRVIADSSQTILTVAREHGIADIPTLCHDDQLEPFASCFVCVVKVKGARTLLPACSTRVQAGMVVATGSSEVRAARRAALELLLSNHFADCVGPCQLACPAGVDIQGYLALAAIGRNNDAVRLIRETNPLPSVCGRVCTRPCEVTGCRRSLLDAPVAIDFVKRYVADLALGQGRSTEPESAPATGKRVAIIGAGPAGLSCAHFLALKGHAAHIFEAMPEAGGMLRYGIPQYRLPKEILDLEIEQILDRNVELSTNIVLGRDITVAGLREEGFDAVFLGLGAWESQPMRVKGEDTPGVLSGIDFLRQFGLGRAEPLTGRVLVVGGGNTAIDCARTAMRLGASEVRLVYRRTRAEMPANSGEIDEALHEGVVMELLTAPTRVVARDGQVAALECTRMVLGSPDASGRRSPSPVRGSEFEMPADWVIAAIGQSTTIAHLLSGKGPHFLPMGETLNLTRWQTVEVNPATGETSVEGVFSGGDLVTGAATAIEAIAAGRKAAHAIDRFLATGRAEGEPRQVTSRKDAFATLTAADLPAATSVPRQIMPTLSADERQRSFAEVELGISPEAASAESHRCMECGCSAAFDCDLRRLASEYGVELTSFRGAVNHHAVDRSHPLLILDPNKCILCGRCVRICAEVVGISAFGFTNRGFATAVRPALGDSLLDTDCISCGLCLGACPTGAIAQHLPVDKPGPWRTARTESICQFCGIGCSLAFETAGAGLVKVSRIADNPIAFGSHCAQGIFGHEFVAASDRLVTARIRPGRELQETSLDDAIAWCAVRFKEMIRRVPPEGMAVFVSPRLSNEEAYLAQKLARIVLRTHNVASLADLASDEFAGDDVVSTATYRDLADAQAILVINADPAADYLVADLAIKRAIRAGARCLVIGAPDSRTGLGAAAVLACTPGSEGEVAIALIRAASEAGLADLDAAPDLRPLLAECDPATLRERTGLTWPEVAAAARLFAGCIVRVVVTDKDRAGLRRPGDQRLIAAIGRALGAGLLALRRTANAQGLADLGVSPLWLPGHRDPADAAAVEQIEKGWGVVLRDVRGHGRGLRQALADGRIRAALILGEDPLGAADFPPELRAGVEQIDFMAAADVFMSATAASARVVLPLSAAIETSGTVTNSERRVQRLRRAVPARPGRESWEVLCDLAAALGARFKFKYSSVDEVTDEIRRIVPFYRELDLDGGGDAGIWELDKARIAGPIELDWASQALRERPRMSALDVVEARFERRFTDMHDAARAVHQHRETVTSQAKA